MNQHILSNVLVRLLSFVVLILLTRFAYVITIKGTAACGSAGVFCFFPKTFEIDDKSSRNISRLRDYYYSVFGDLIAEGFLSPDSRSLCIDTLTGEDVIALRNLGVNNSIGISNKLSLPLVRYGSFLRQSFDDDYFDFEFSGVSGLDDTVKPAEFVSQVLRTLKIGGFFVVHSVSKDLYSLNSLLELFNSSSRLIRSREIDDVDSPSLLIREIVLRKEKETVNNWEGEEILDGNSAGNCSVPRYKQETISMAEPLIKEEPLKPWLTLKRNLRNVRYLSSMVDISFKNRYVYVDVGARNYGSSIGSWFKKVYPKQNKTFEIYAIEADTAFHKEYELKKNVNLLPYAAWVRNESLFFQINREPGGKKKKSSKEKTAGRGMGRIGVVQSSSKFVGSYDKIMGFDFASWLKSTISNRDYVLVKMDVEGTEFHLIPRLIETGAICLIDEMFLECHYNRWQRCCPGERSPKYQKTYAECLDLFISLRKSGVLVHQWW